MAALGVTDVRLVLNLILNVLLYYINSVHQSEELRAG